MGHTRNAFALLSTLFVCFILLRQVTTGALVGIATTERSLTSEQEDTPEAVLARIRIHVGQLLGRPQPKLFERHLRSVVALCEEEAVKLQLGGAHRGEQAKELLGYLKVIETGLEGDGERPDTYLLDGKLALTLARLSRSDGTLQFYTVHLPPHWNAQKAYPLYVQLHGRGPDIPLAYVYYTFLPNSNQQRSASDAIRIVPWLRGNGEWRNENGSEPDIWEAIDDVKTFAKLDADRWYISGHSWGGDDAWAIVQRTPDLWAAAGIMAGNPISAPVSLGLISNAKDVPFYLWLGEQDKERKGAFEEFRTGLNSVGNIPKLVVSSGVGHMYRPEDETEMEAWLFQHVRRRPNRFSFLVDTPQHRGIWGISIPRKYPWAYPQAEPRASFECWIDDSAVRIQTSRTRILEVDLGPAGLRMVGNVTLVVNGKQRFAGPVPEKPLSIIW